MPELKFLGHACFMLREGKNALIIDPYLTGNPIALTTAEQIECQHILVSHGHEDHLGDAVSIAKKTAPWSSPRLKSPVPALKKEYRPMPCILAASIVLILVLSALPLHFTGPVFRGDMPVDSSSSFMEKQSTTQGIPASSATWPYWDGWKISMSPYCRLATTLPWDLPMPPKPPR